jgi:hypothetical protein
MINTPYIAEHFSGVIPDIDKRNLRFSMDKFAGELEEALPRFDNPTYFDVSESHSPVYHRFLALNLKNRPAVRGQLERPISFGFKILDQDDRPILFDDTVRPLILDLMVKRLNVQSVRFKQRNANAFMFVDEPGLQFLFSAMAGYGDLKARGDLDQFFTLVDRPLGIHLTHNPRFLYLSGLLTQQSVFPMTNTKHGEKRYVTCQERLHCSRENHLSQGTPAQKATDLGTQLEIQHPESDAVRRMTYPKRASRTCRVHAK